MKTMSPAEIATGTWTIDPLHSSVSFAVRHFGITWLRGSFTSFDASLVAGEDGALALTGSAPVSAMSFGDSSLVGHLASPDFFDAELHPELRFSSGAVELDADGSARVVGEMTMRGVTRSVTLIGSWSGPLEDMSGSSRLGLELEGSLDRFDYGVAWTANLAGGAEVVGRIVRLTAELELVLQ